MRVWSGGQWLQSGGRVGQAACLHLQSIEMERRGKGDAHVPLNQVAFDTVFSTILRTVASWLQPQLAAACRGGCNKTVIYSGIQNH